MSSPSPPLLLRAPISTHNNSTTQQDQQDPRTTIATQHDQQGSGSLLHVLGCRLFAAILTPLLYWFSPTEYLREFDEGGYEVGYLDKAGAQVVEVYNAAGENTYVV
jgi:hypothetical protein